MTDDDFEAWTLCWEVNQAFQVKRTQMLSDVCLCVGCNKRGKAWSLIYRSEFPSLAVRCPEGHGELIEASEADVCVKCNQDFVLKVSSRTIFCTVPGCRKVLIVDEDIVRERLQRKEELLGRYLRFLETKKIFECNVCGEVLSLSETPVLQATKCNHDPNMCLADLRTFLEETITRGELKNLKCPDAECGAKIASRDVRKLVSPEIFQRFNERITSEVISRNPLFRWCQGTVDGQPCTNGQIHLAGAKIPNWVCSICKNMNCFNCHPSVCTYHIQTKDEESFKTIRKVSKLCPKRGCGRRLMRAGGCAHMTCKMISGNGCGSEWCWSCKIIWVGGSRGHLEACPWRISPPVSAPSLYDALYAPEWNSDPGYDKIYDKDLWMPGSLR